MVNYALIRIIDYKEFELKLNAILSTGFSKSPRHLNADIGFNIATEEFWQKGMAQFVTSVNMLKEIPSATPSEENRPRRVWITPRKAKGGFEISIADNGRGISDEKKRICLTQRGVLAESGFIRLCASYRNTMNTSASMTELQMTQAKEQVPTVVTEVGCFSPIMLAFKISC